MDHIVIKLLSTGDTAICNKLVIGFFNVLNVSLFYVLDDEDPGKRVASSHMLSDTLHRECIKATT